MLKRRAMAMANAVDAGMSKDDLYSFFRKCLEAHALDTLKELM
jgi:hypothetical protein